MHLLGFLGLAVIGLTPPFLMAWYDPRSRRRRERLRRERLIEHLRDDTPPASPP